MPLFDTMTFSHPVLRVNNRDLNIAFYRDNLGLRLVSEENAIAIFSAWENPNASFVIEESPANRTRAVIGDKKLRLIQIKVSKASDIAALLGNGAVTQCVYHGKNGYAFEALSPEGDRFLLHAEDDTADLREIERYSLPKVSDFKGVSDFSVLAISLHVPNVQRAQAFYQAIFPDGNPLSLDFTEGSGEDLCVAPNETWDVEILEYHVPKSYDLRALARVFEEKGLVVYLDRRETVLVISDTSNIELWFVK